MEKRKQKQSSLQFQDLQFQFGELKPRKNEKNTLYQLIPKQIKQTFSQDGETKQQLYNCLVNLHQYSKPQQLRPLFEEIGADLNFWLSKNTATQKSQYLLAMLDKNVEQSLKRVNTQASAYVNNVVNTSKAERKRNAAGKKKNDFDWLTLNTKNEMLKSKLKTKLVQTINQYKNEKRLREVMGKQLQQDEKIHLQDQSIDLYQDEKDKLNYQWSGQDQEMFLLNIKKLKEKFTQTEFLKYCHRFKFITQSQLKTLASQEISRKLDKSNKAFLSRQFLLDKYFSTKETLTQKQMKFILKTSPLLSRCVDKAFVRAAIKNIRYQDIDKMELQIAQQIIQKFEMIRNIVKKSRKDYKQKQNSKTKQRIQQFERMKKYDEMRAILNEGFQKHKVKVIRNVTFRPETAFKTTNKFRRNKQNDESLHFMEGTIPKKMVWPIPLNTNHPSTGLFIKDCSQQLSEEFNQYEKNYLKNVFNSQNHQNKPKISNQTKSSMMKFYTGGPIESSASQRNLLNIPQKQSGVSKLGQNSTLNAICQAFKTAEYRKQIQYKLNTFDLDEEQCEELSDCKQSSAHKSMTDLNFPETNKKSKKPSNQQIGQNAGPSYQAIKDRIIEGRQKAKMSVFVKKLLTLAAQNSFLSLKALNVKFSPTQINSMDGKGNTALFYATKHRNEDFIDHLLAMKADINTKCSKGLTPLHNAFKTSNYSIICKCLSSTPNPNLNAVDDDGKTPLAYCCRKVLQMLGLQQGVVQVSQSSKLKFNNNSLLCRTEQPNPNSQLQAKVEIRRKQPIK